MLDKSNITYFKNCYEAVRNEIGTETSYGHRDPHMLKTSLLLERKKSLKLEKYYIFVKHSRLARVGASFTSNISTAIETVAMTTSTFPSRSTKSPTELMAATRSTFDTRIL